MPTPAYLNFIAQPVVSPIILAEIQPKERLQGWTLSSGLTNTYELAWSDTVQQSVYPGGLYRELTNVQANETELTERASKALVEASASSWYFDSSASILYAHLPNSDAPDANYTVVFAEFTVRLASSGVVLGGFFYEPLLDSQSEVTIEQSTEHLLFGDIKHVGSANLKLMNGTGLFDELSADWEWNAGQVDVLFGGPGLTYGSYESLGSFNVESFIPGFELVEITARDIQSFTHQPVTKNFFTTAEYPQLDENYIGARIPVVLGSLTNAPTIKIKSTQKGEFLIADPNIQSLYSVDAVYVDGSLVPNADYSVSLSGCTVTILSTYSGATPTASQVTCDVNGQPVSGAAYETSTDYLKYYGELVSWIYNNSLGVPLAKINSSAAATLDADDPRKQGLYVNDDIHAHHLIRRLELGVLGRTIICHCGTVTPKAFFPAAAEAVSADKSITNPDVVYVQPLPRGENLFSEFQALYGANIANSTVKVTTSTSDLTRILRLDGRDVSHELDTRLVLEADAKLLADRTSIIYQARGRDLEIEQAGISLFHLSVLDRIKLSLDRAPTSTGAFSDHVMEILSITKQLAPIPRVVLSLSDFSNTSTVGFWTSLAYPLYVNATEDEKNNAGWWTEANGEIVSGDPATKTSVWL